MTARTNPYVDVWKIDKVWLVIVLPWNSSGTITVIRDSEDEAERVASELRQLILLDALPSPTELQVRYAQNP